MSFTDNLEQAMRLRATAVFVVPALLALPAAAAAQDATGLRFHVNVGIPVGDYGATEGDAAGHAGPGIGLGFGYAAHVVPGFAWMTDLSVSAHPAYPSLIAEPDLEPGCLYGVYSALTGPRLSVSTPDVRVSGSVQGGVAAAHCPAGVWVEDGTPRRVYRGWYGAPAPAFAAAASIGARRIDFGARYVLAPSVTFEERIEMLDTHVTQRTETQRSMGYIDIFVAYWMR